MQKMRWKRTRKTEEERKRKEQEEKHAQRVKAEEIRKVETPRGVQKQSGSRNNHREIAERIKKMIAEYFDARRSLEGVSHRTPRAKVILSRGSPRVEEKIGRPRSLSGGRAGEIIRVQSSPSLSPSASPRQPSTPKPEQKVEILPVVLPEITLLRAVESDEDYSVVLDYASSGIYEFTVDELGRDALQKAVDFENKAVIEILAAAGFNCNRPYEGRGGQSPLHVAAAKNNTLMAKSLVDAGVRFKQDSNGWTALHEATRNLNRLMISYFVKHGALINLPNSVERPGAIVGPVVQKNQSALDLVQSTGPLDAVNKEKKDQILEYFFEIIDRVSFKDQAGNTPLCYALICGDILTAQYLAYAGAHFENINKRKHSVLHECVLMANQALLDFFLRLHAVSNARDHKGRSALHLAAATNQKDMVERLLGANADINLADSDGFTPLDYAQAGKQAICIDYIRSRGGRSGFIGLEVSPETDRNAAKKGKEDTHKISEGLKVLYEKLERKVASLTQKPQSPEANKT